MCCSFRNVLVERNEVLGDVDAGSEAREALLMAREGVPDLFGVTVVRLPYCLVLSPYPHHTGCG